jgi:hypothetical protein
MFHVEQPHPKMPWPWTARARATRRSSQPRPCFHRALSLASSGREHSAARSAVTHTTEPSSSHRTCRLRRHEGGRQRRRLATPPKDVLARPPPPATRPGYPTAQYTATSRPIVTGLAIRRSSRASLPVPPANDAGRRACHRGQRREWPRDERFGGIAVVVAGWLQAEVASARIATIALPPASIGLRGRLAPDRDASP